MRKFFGLFVAFMMAICCLDADAQKWQTERGYRGFADLNFGVESVGMVRFGVSTTHGYQVVPSYLFIGGGLQADLWNVRGVALPLYSDFRVQFPTGKWSALIDTRLGCMF